MDQENNPQPVIMPSQWVYEHLVCEFYHWDLCLIGLVSWDGEYWLCRLIGDPVDYPDPIEYTLHKVKWTPECTEYLDDYRKAYIHWFHEGKPRCRYDGRSLKWFEDKWEHKNPIEDQAV